MLSVREKFDSFKEPAAWWVNSSRHASLSQANRSVHKHTKNHLKTVEPEAFLWICCFFKGLNWFSEHNTHWWIISISLLIFTIVLQDVTYLIRDAWVSGTRIFLNYFLQLQVNRQLSLSEKFEEKEKHIWTCCVRRIHNAGGALCVWCLILADFPLTEGLAAHLLFTCMLAMLFVSYREWNCSSTSDQRRSWAQAGLLCPCAHAHLLHAAEGLGAMVTCPIN